MTDVADVDIKLQSPVYQLRSFQLLDAPVIAGWATTELQLRWLAPSTLYPLTAAKVVEWKKPGGHPLVFAGGSADAFVAYGELNPMLQQECHYWLGHVVVSPEMRGLGIGQAFIRALLHRAYTVLRATKVSLLVFPANRAAISCYRRVGFSGVANEYHQFTGTGIRRRLLRMEIHGEELENMSHDGHVA